MEKFDFTAPGITFDYIADSVLWNEIWLQPFKTEDTQAIKLSHYFTVNDVMFGELTMRKERRKLLRPVNNYYKTDEKEMDYVFLNLHAFLHKHSRPHKNCLVYIPNHPTIKPKNGYSPFSINYEKPNYLALTEDKDMFEITFDKKYYPEIYKYIFGFETEPSENCKINFSFSLFGGLIF